MSQRWNQFDAINLAQIESGHLLPYSKEDEPANQRSRVIPLGTLYQWANQAPLLIVPEDRTLAPDDQGAILLFTGERTVTLPDGAPAGMQTVIVNYGGDPITLVAETTLEAAGDTIIQQYGAATVVNLGDDAWLAFGALTDVS